MNRFSNITDLLHLPRFLPTLQAIVLTPKQFFSHYYELVLSRQPNLFDINYEKDGDKYLGPVKFSALAIGINNFLFPIFLYLGVQAGAISSDFYRFSQWAKKEGYLDATAFTGISFVDSTIMDLLALGVMYGLGVLIWLFSTKKISVRFATGYFFYLNAWSLLGTLISMCFIVVGLILPIYATGIPQLIGIVVQFAAIFMFLVFPIWIWPEIIRVERQTVAIAYGLAFVCWVTVLAIVGPMIIRMPQF
ncbi:MAG: hypothetical protein ACRBBN_07130 [Methyloligellaceae bacterium]